MRICRYGGGKIGLVEGHSVADVTPILANLSDLHWPVPPGDHFIRHLHELESKIRTIADARMERTDVQDVCLESPVANPSRVIAAPLNYVLHIEEGKDPAINHGVHMPSYEGFATPIDKFGLFLKSQTGVVGPGEGIQLHFPDRRNDHEAELAVVIGREGKNIDQGLALTYVAGYCIGLDITARGSEDRSFRKSADSYSVLGPWLVTADEIPDPGALGFELTVNGKTRQRSNTRELIVDIPSLISRASQVYALHPGDIIMTGTPAGVGQIIAGDTISVSFEGIGAMDVRVR